MIQGGRFLLLKHPPQEKDGTDAFDLVYGYFGSVALQLTGRGLKNWETTFMPALARLQKQRKDGCRWGSWDPQIASWGEQGGRVYATAMSCLTLQNMYFNVLRLK